MATLRIRDFLPIMAVALVLLAGCETPERRAALERMEKIEAGNSALKAKAESEAAQAKIEMSRQRSEDLRVIEALNARLNELSAQVAALKQGSAAQPAQPTPEETAAQERLKAELERVKAETRAQMERMQEDLARAQAQAEAAKLAAAELEKRGKEGVTEEASWNGQKLPVAKYVDAAGKLVDLSQYVGKKTICLVIMKGFYSEGICFYCTKQTSELAKAAELFKAANTEVLVVYPGVAEQINAFVRSVREYQKSEDPRFRLPFPVLLDVNQDAVRALRIDGDLAHPTSFVIDRQGVVRYQKVGRTMSDRPAVEDLLKIVKGLEGKQP